MLFQAVLGNLERKRFSPCGQHSRSVVQLFSLRKFTNHFWKIKSNPDIIYYVKCPEGQCSEDYTRETAQRLSERVLDHNGKDANSHLIKHAIEKCHKYPKIEDFNV